MIGTRIVVPHGAKIRADYRRGGRGCGSQFFDELPPGRYIVDDYDRVEEWEGPDVYLLLAAANWEEDEDPDSRVTFHSSKHLYLVKRSSLKVTIDLFESIQTEVAK